MSSRTHSKQPGQPQATGRRPVWIVMFAIAVIWFAKSAPAADPDVAFLNPAFPNPAFLNPGRLVPCVCVSEPSFLVTQTDPPAGGGWMQLDGISFVSPGTSLPRRTIQSGDRQPPRPDYVQVHARLANFDADASVDGWSVELVLRDQADRIVTAPAQATFRLTTRVSTIDSRRHVDFGSSPIKWSSRLDFGDDGIARVKLPSRRVGLRTTDRWAQSDHRWVRSESPRGSGWGTRGRSAGSSMRTIPLRSGVGGVHGGPQEGRLHVRVTLANGRTLEAETLVRFRAQRSLDHS